MNWKKWVAARVTAITGLIVMLLTTESWDKEESIMAVTIVSAAIVSILTPADQPST